MNETFKTMGPETSLKDFAYAFREEAKVYGYLPSGINAVHNIGIVTVIVLYRNGPFQVEMFAIPSNFIIPEHTHPNVESYELHIGGDIAFSHDGRWVDKDKFIPVPGSDNYRNSLIYVKTSDLHGSVIGPRGGVFMSIQKWLNGTEPSCVALDYDGIVVGTDHHNKVNYGKPKLKSEQKDLTWKDAASKETTPPRFPRYFKRK